MSMHLLNGYAATREAVEEHAAALHHIVLLHEFGLCPAEGRRQSAGAQRVPSRKLQAREQPAELQRHTHPLSTVHRGDVAEGIDGPADVGDGEELLQQRAEIARGALVDQARQWLAR